VRPFPLIMAWRETRAAWRHFVYFVLCIAVGVGAVVGIGLFAANVEHAVTREARGLLGGDLEIRSSRALSESGRSVLQSAVERGARLSHASELVAMAATAGQPSTAVTTQVIELKAVESTYPLYGMQFIRASRFSLWTICAACFQTSPSLTIDDSWSLLRCSGPRIPDDQDECRARSPAEDRPGDICDHRDHS